MVKQLEKMVKILVDADACPVKGIITDIAQKYKLKVIFLIDTSHILSDDYAEVVMVDKGMDSVDMALINKTAKEDIVITQDYGLAAMAMSMGAYPIHPSGMIFSNENIDKLLFERHLNAKVRRAGGRHAGPGKRRDRDNDSFKTSLEKLCLIASRGD